MGLHVYLIQNGEKDFDMDKKVGSAFGFSCLSRTVTYGAGEPKYKPHAVGLVICSWLPAILKAG